jgi:peptide/nickel transport system permease protein
MFRFIIRRLLQLVPTLFGLSVLLFVWVRRLPGGPATALLGERATPDRIRQVNAMLGLDQPLYVQYGRFMRRLLDFDFGNSTQTGRPVTEEFLERFPATIELTIVAMVIAIGIGIPLGFLAARRHGSFLDTASVGASLLGICIPVFFLGYLLKYVFALTFHLLPTQGRVTAGLQRTDVTGFYVLDGILTRELDVVGDALLHLILPGLTLASIPLAIIVRMTRASVLEVLGEDYVRTAEAKGLTERTVRRRHILRNALLPVVTTIGLLTGGLLSGAVLTESVFALNGVGSFVKDAIFYSDYPGLMGFVLTFSVIYVLVNLAVDISYSVIDPRVRVR